MIHNLVVDYTYIHVVNFNFILHLTITYIQRWKTQGLRITHQ